VHWRLKGTLQKLLGALPGGEALHYRLQRRFGGMRDPRREMRLKLEDWELMVRQLRADGLEIAGKTLLEVGSGWYPLLPLACHLGGAARVHTCDLNRLLKPELMRLCIDVLGEQLPRIADVSGQDLAEVQARHTRLREVAAATDDLVAITGGGVDYRAPADATDPGLPDASLDLIFSNSVLEHVPPPAIARLHRASLRLLRPGGRVFHSVNCGDHYAYVDPALHQLHYLRYSDRDWAFWNNRFLYQNRLRAHELVDGAREAGFVITLDTSLARQERLEQLAAMTVAAQFAHIPPERLCITTVDFIGRTPD